MLNFHANPIIYVVIDAEKHAAEPRRLKPNLAVDTCREESIPLEELQQGLGQMFGTHTILTGFGLAGTLEALNLAAPPHSGYRFCNEFCILPSPGTICESQEETLHSETRSLSIAFRSGLLAVR